MTETATETLAASRPVEQDLNHVRPSDASDNLVPRRQDTHPGAVDGNLTDAGREWSVDGTWGYRRRNAACRDCVSRQ